MILLTLYSHLPSLPRSFKVSLFLLFVETVCCGLNGLSHTYPNAYIETCYLHVPEDDSAWMHLYKADEVRRRSTGWALIHHDSCPFKKKCEHRHTQRAERGAEPSVNTGWRLGIDSSSQPKAEANPSTPWYRTFCLQNSERIYRFKSPSCGTLPWYT